MRISRRAMMTAAAGAVGRSAQGAAWKMRLSTSSVLFNTLPVEEACARIAEAGYDAVDFWQGERFHANHLEEARERLGGKGLGKVLAEKRLKLCSFTCFFIGIEKYAEMLGQAGRGEGAFIRESRYYGGSAAASGGATRPKDIDDLRRQMGDLIESLAPSLKLADKYGFRVAIENHSNAILNSVDSFKVFLDLAKHPRLWIAIAPYHLQRDKIPVEEVIALAGQRSLFFYAWQNEPEVKQMPGLGATDFTPWIGALAKAGYRGYVNPFMHENLKAGPGEDRRALSPERMAETLVQARRYLEQCREKVRE